MSNDDRKGRGGRWEVRPGFEDDKKDTRGRPKGRGERSFGGGRPAGERGRSGGGRDDRSRSGGGGGGDERRGKPSFDRGGRGGDERRGKPSFDRGGRSGDERRGKPSFDRGGRDGGGGRSDGSRPRYAREGRDGERSRDDRPRYDRDSSRGGRDGGRSRDDRPRYDRDSNRGGRDGGRSRDDRPRHDRDANRGGRGKPAFGGSGGGDRGKPAFGRSEGRGSGAPRGRGEGARGANGAPSGRRYEREPSATETISDRPLGDVVTIQSLDVAGAGLGVTESGDPARIPGTLPGEKVHAFVEHEARDGTRHGRLRTVEEASPDRVEPGCRHFLVCGGCDFLHMAPEAERAFKRARVAEALGRELEEVDPVLPSPRDTHYRAVAKLVFGPGGRLGSFAPRSHRVVDMFGCRIHAPVIERVAETVRRALQRGVSHEGARYLVLRAALPTEAVHVTLVMREAGLEAEGALLEALAGHPEVAEVWRHVNATEGDAIIDEAGPTQCIHRGSVAVGRVGSAEQHLATGAFAQVNPGAAERMYARVSELIEPEGKRVLDLYSGSGGISLTLLAAGAYEVLGIERSKTAVEAARKSAQPFRGAGHFESASAEQVKDYLVSPEASEVVPGSGGGFPAWVVNPPRKGLAPEVIEAIRTLMPERVVYVSCHPDRLARDLEALKDAYWVDSVTPVDMFPQTRHVETVARLRLLRRD